MLRYTTLKKFETEADKEIELEAKKEGRVYEKCIRPDPMLPIFKVIIDDHRRVNVYKSTNPALNCRISWIDANSAWMSYQGNSYKVEMHGLAPVFKKGEVIPEAVEFNRKRLEENPGISNGFEIETRWVKCDLPVKVTQFVLLSNGEYLKSTVKGNTVNCGGTVAGRRWWYDIEDRLVLETSGGKWIYDNGKANRFFDAIKASAIGRNIKKSVKKARESVFTRKSDEADARAAIGI